MQVCFAHGGGSFPYTVGRIAHGFTARPDLCAVSCDVSPREYLGRIYTDSLVHDPSALDLLLNTIGEVGAGQELLGLLAWYLNLSL